MAIPTNMGVYLGLDGKTRKVPGEALGITRNVVSMKICDEVGWSVSDLIMTAGFLDVTSNTLMDDTILSRAEAGYTKSAEYGAFAEKPGTLMGADSPGFLASPSNFDAPAEGGISGVAKGTLAGSVPLGVPSDSDSSPNPLKHDGIGISDRSQTYEILRTVAIVIMRTPEGSTTISLSDDKAPSIVANFLGFATSEKEWVDPYTSQPSYDKFYNGLTFHCIIKQFMIQGGCLLGTDTGNPGYEFGDEVDPNLKFDKPYPLAMTDAGLRRSMDGKVHGTSGSQFFIITMPTPWPNDHHTIFGEVADDDSKKAVDKLGVLGTDSMDRPLESIMILSVDVAE